MREHIVTHQSPDFDAICYLWLVKRFASQVVPTFKDAEINLMSLSRIDQDVLEAAISVGDMGGVYRPETWRFDHHHLEGSQSTNTCAAKMLWEYLLYLGIDVSYLSPLIKVIWQGDLARTEPVGIHSILWGGGLQKNLLTGQRLTDMEMVAVGFDLLDRAAAWLKHKVETKAELDEKVIWKSDDKLIWAIRGGTPSVTFSAYDKGARIVVFEGEPIKTPEGISYPMGASRAPEWKEPHLGKLVDLVLSSSPVAKELTLWFRHQDGFFAGRGSRKAPCYELPKCDLKDLATFFNTAWKR
jgi:hypothetical protein